MPNQAPGDELWDRLRAFDQTCNIDLARISASDPKFWGTPRVWQVSIHARVPGARIWDTIRACHPTLAEAIRLAVEQAEAKGWDTPRLTLRGE